MACRSSRLTDCLRYCSALLSTARQTNNTSHNEGRAILGRAERQNTTSLPISAAPAVCPYLCSPPCTACWLHWRVGGYGSLNQQHSSILRDTHLLHHIRRRLPHRIPPHLLKSLQKETSECVDSLAFFINLANVSLLGSGTDGQGILSFTERAQREPWFGPHHARDIYVSLLSMDPPPPRNVLVSALIRRAVVDIQRVMEIRENKAALQNLLMKGQIGDDTWNHLLETEKEMDSELYEVVQEANHFRPGWGQYIFPHAGDMIQHEKNKKLFDTIDQERKRLGASFLSLFLFFLSPSSFSSSYVCSCSQLKSTAKHH